MKKSSNDPNDGKRAPIASLVDTFSRSGVSAERRKSKKDVQMAALCRGTATVQWKICALP